VGALLKMVKVSYITFNKIYLDLMRRHLYQGDRFIHGSIKKINAFYGSLQSFKNASRSLLPQIRDLWRSLTLEEKQSWQNKARSIGKKTYNLFTKDTIFRLKLGLPGVSIPNDLYEAEVYRFDISNFSDRLKLIQVHPQTYYYYRKVKGTKKQLEPVEIKEVFRLPLTISISYRSDLEAGGSDYKAKYYAEIYHSWQGVNLITPLEINFNLKSDWVNVSNTIDNVRGYIFGYALFLEFQNVKGKIQLDHIKAEHSLQNWCRDWLCDDLFSVSQARFWTVLPNWAVLDITDGVTMASVYYAEW
jgi:gamma-glutamylcyclotransferase (GGCT)/AIG2-like uncharacterized protein YtfP